jgi:hypothetical protein
MGHRLVGETKEIVGHIAPFDAKEVTKWLGKGRVTHAQALRWSPWVYAGERKCEYSPPEEADDVNFGQIGLFWYILGTERRMQTRSPLIWRTGRHRR